MKISVQDVLILLSFLFGLIGLGLFTFALLGLLATVGIEFMAFAGILMFVAVKADFGGGDRE